MASAFPASGWLCALGFSWCLSQLRLGSPVLANLVSGEGTVPSPRMDIIFLCLHAAEGKTASPVFLLIGH